MNYEFMFTFTYYRESYIISQFLKAGCMNVSHNSEVLTSDFFFFFLSTQQEMDCISVSYLLEEQSAEG